MALPLNAWYVEADPADTTWQIGALRSEDTDGLETTSSFAAGSEAWVAINGGYFGGGQSYSLVAQDGEVITPNIGALNRSGTIFWPTRSAFAVLDDGTPDVAWIYDVAGTQYFYPAPSPNAIGSPEPQPSAAFPEGGAPWPLGTAIGGGPVIVEDGQERITWEQEVFFGSGIGEITTRNPRTAVGYTAEGKIILLVVDGRQFSSVGASLIELANIMISLGAVEAINLDGGGSSTIVADGTLLNRPEGGTNERQVASALVLKPRGSGGGGQTGETIIFDTGDTCCYTEVGEWSNTANAGFYGTTPSRINETGTGEDRAIFLLDQIPSDTYELAAWWVPSFNRATNTPFTVYHNGVGTTVNVDQSDPQTLNRWNVLGSFELAAEDSIVVTDAASGTTSPAYVVTDAIQLTPAGGTSIDGIPIPMNHSIVVYPNPTSDRLAVQLPGGSPQVWHGEIMDVLGRRIHSFEGDGFQRGHVWIQLPNLASGTYIVRMMGREESYHRAFVVAR